MVSTAMTITASRATTNPATSPVGSSGGLPAGPGVMSSVVEVVLVVLGESVDVWAIKGVEEWGGGGVDEWAGEGVEEWASGGVEEATKFVKTEKVKMYCMPHVAW